MNPTTPSTVQNTARDLSQCARCGANTEPMRPRDVKTGSYFAPRWVLGAVCVDAAACAERAAARDAHMDERWALTEAGRQYLEERDPVISLTAEPGVYVADSQTVTGITYTLTAPSGEPVCSCPGYFYSGHCKHARQLGRILAGRAVLTWREQGEQLPLAVA